MSYRLLAIVLVTCLSQKVAGQFTYRLDQSIPVEVNGQPISLPWAGGLNSAQINKMDLNGDGQEDLVVFERTANKVLTFLNENKTYRYEPLYESLFPDLVDQWLLLRDFNCDGKKDIFTHDTFGIAVFVNTTQAGQPLTWRPFNPGFPLLTIGFNPGVPINLQVNGTDIPGIDDIDGDGDLDILDARFVGIGSIEWHKNMSIENTGRCDSIQLVRQTQTWGNFEECNCGEYLYGGGSCTIYNGRIEHAAGKTILTIDVDNDGDRDLLFSEETCSDTYFLLNNGTKDNANMTGFTAFPATTPITNFQIFPAPYFEDVDFDGVPDLVVSSNAYTRSLFSIDFQKSVWFYKNTGSRSLPVFNFVKNNFLQDQMIEVGDNASPAFFDEDGDGDLDMFIASYNSPFVVSFVYFYENTGTSGSPAFKYITNDYAGISKNGLYNVKLQFADMNADGRTDLAFTATSAQTGITSLQFIPNQSDNRLDIAQSVVANTNFIINVDENVLVVDVNLDGVKDLLVGKSTGAVQYWINRGAQGNYAYILQNDSFLGLGISTDRQSPVITTGDLDADGKTDLVMGDQRGAVTIYTDFRNGDTPTGVQNILWDSLSQTYTSGNLGGRVWPVVVNLFNNYRPSIVLGNLLGGIQILKNDNSASIPDEAVINVFPNPTLSDKIFFVQADRNVSCQIYTMLGQGVLSKFTIPAYDRFKVDASALAAGVYILKFSVDNKTFGKRIIIR